MPLFLQSRANTRFNLPVIGIVVSKLARIFGFCVVTVGLSTVGCSNSNDDAVTLEYARGALTQNGVTSSLSIDDDWGNGFCGSVSVVNKSKRPVRHWQLELMRHGSDIGRKWSGLQVLPGDRLLVVPTKTNENIPVGGTVQVPFCGSGTTRPSLASMQVDILDSSG
jgi:cellulase/cellobiase CelA1